METTSGKYYHNNRGNLQKDNPSKKENLLVSSNGVKLTLPDDECDSLALQQKACNKEISNINEMDSSEPSFSVNQDTNRENILSQSSEFEDSIEYDFLNETYSIHYSESKLKNEDIHLHSELCTEVQNREEALFDTLELQGNNTIGFERTHKVSNASYEETAKDTAQTGVDEDSQLEYHSAEQEYISNHLSFDQAKTLSVSNLHCVELSNSGYDDKWVSGQEDDHVQLESGSVTSLDSLNECTFAQEYSPPVSKFQNSAMLKEYHEPKHDKYKEHETGLMYHTVFDDIVQRSSSLLNLQKPLKAKIHTEQKKSQTITKKDFCGTGIVEDKILQHLDHSSISPQEKASEILPQVSKDGQTSGTSSFDDSLISACGCLQYKGLQSTPNPKTSAIQAVTEDSCLQVVKSNTTKKTCPQSVTDAASCTITVSQTLDVSTDFRPCFTTSRATTEKSPVVSTSSNTEITMVDRKCPDEWPRERQRSVACNTDWAHLQDYAHTLMAVPTASGRLLSVDRLKPSGHSLSKDSLEIRKMFDTTDLKKRPERELQFSEEMEKNLASECCQKTMHRAIKAEMHLLNVYYQTCRRHCCHIYKLVVENRAELNRNLPNNFAKKELGSALLSVLGDLRVRYMDLKERIYKGIPLEELPPLSVESKILSVFSAFASRLMKEDSLIFSGADSELENRSVPDVDICSGLKETLSQMSLLPDSGHPKQDTSPKEDGFKNNDINVNFSQLKLNDKECRNHCEISEDWCDATENLMGSDISGTKEDQIEHDTWNLNFLLERKHAELVQGDKGFLIHVGGLCSSVSEADLRSHFQKYQVSEILIYDSSTNYRYASLAFTKISDAKRAAKEMNGTEINGKSINVRLIKSSAEHTWDRVSLDHLEKSSKEGIKKNCKQIESHLLPETSAQLIPPNTLNLRSFTKIMKRLTELHPEVSRDQIIDALQEVRTNHKGFLNGLSIGTIVEMTSSFLKNAASH